MERDDAGPRTIGLVGVGLLGTAIAERLLSRGFRVIGTDIDPARCQALRGLGGAAVACPADLAGRCARIVLSLPTSAIARGVLADLEPHLARGQTIIDTTTGAPDEMAALGHRLAARGAWYLDATVSGPSTQARRGEVVLMVGGDGGAFAACADVFEALARLTFHLGPCGSGAKMKLATNLVLGLNRAALAEGLAFARALGLDAEVTLGVLRESMAYSRTMDTKGPKMVQGDFTPEARLSQHLKDVRLVLEEARRAGLGVPLSEAHRGLLEAAEAAGHGDLDNSAILRAYDRG